MKNFQTILLFLACFTAQAQKKNLSESYFHPVDLIKTRTSFHRELAGYPMTEGIASGYLMSKTERLRSASVSLSLSSFVESPGGLHYTFSPYYKGVKIFRSQIKMNTDKQGYVLSVFDNTFPFTDPSGEFPDEAVLSSFLKHSVPSSAIAKTENVYLWNGSRMVPAARVEITSEDDFYEVIIDHQGNVLYQRDLALYSSAPSGDSAVSASAFLPDPLTTAGVTYGAPYTDDNDNEVTVLNNERVSVSILTTYDSGANLFRLENPYVKITDHSPPSITPATSASAGFSFTRGADAFEDVNVLYHITAFQEYVQSLGFTNLASYQIHADAHGLSGQDNSSFISSTVPPRLSFGEGGVDDAEDADVIVHEYGHAISHSAAPNTNSGNERTALDEALGDYLAASYSRAIDPFGWDRVFSWDGHNEFWGGRYVVSSKHYPDDMANNLYTDAELWSSTLMQIWEDIGKEKTDRILLQSLYSYATGMTMAQAAMLLIQADSLLYSSAHHSELCNRLHNRGFVDQWCTVGIESPETVDTNTLITISGSGAFAAGRAALSVSADGESFTICIYDILGRMVFFTKSANSPLLIHPDPFSVGSYVMKVISGSTVNSFSLQRIE